MDINTFQQILVSLNSQDNNTRTQAEEVFTSFMQTNYLGFLELLVLFMSNSDSALIRKQCVIYLFTTARRDSLFLTPQVLNFLWPKLKEHYVEILSSTIFPPEGKDLFCSIIALCASLSYSLNRSTEIQLFLLTCLETHPTLVKYVALSLTELFIAADSTCGISFQNILTIVNSDISSVTNAALFFSIAALDPNEEVLHRAFEEILRAIQPQDISEFLKVVMNFAETSASFFGPHMPGFTEYLCQVALNRNLGIERNYAMMCMASIARGAPQMCQVSNEKFIFPVIQCIISVISEIDDDAPWEYDTNDTSSNVIAKDSFGIIAKACGNQTFYNFFIDLMNQVLSKPDQPWQVVYAFITALADLDITTLSSFVITNDKNVRSDQMLPVVKISLQILPYIQNLNCHPRIRHATYEVITQLCRYIGPYYQTEAGQYVLPTLKDLIFKETHPITSKSVIQCLTAFFSNVTSKDLITDFDINFRELISMLSTAPNDLKPLIARCLGFYAKAGNNQFTKYFPIMAEAMLNLVNDPNVMVRISAIEAFAISCYKIQVPNEYLYVCSDFLGKIIEILKSPKKNDLSEKQLENSNIAICILIGRLGPYFKPFADKVVPDAIQEASASIEVTSVGAMDFTNEGFSFQMQIPVINVSGAKQFVNKADVQSVCKALDIINTAEGALKKDFIRYLEPTINIAQQWLSSQYHIEQIKIIACNIMHSCIPVALSNNTAAQIIPLTADLYLKNVTLICSQRFIKSLIRMVQRAMFIRIDNQMLGLEHYVKILKTMPPLIELTLERKNKILIGQQQWQTGELNDREVDKQDEVLGHIADLLKQCFKGIPQLTIPFFQQQMMHKFVEYIQREESQVMAIIVWTEYIIASNDLQNLQLFLPALFNFASMKNIDLSSLAFDNIGYLFTSINFERENVHNCYLFFKQEMNKDYMVEQEFSQITDHALIALTKIIIKYQAELKNRNVLSFWFEMLPIWDASDTCDIVYSFLATLLEEKNDAIFNEDNYERIVSLITSSAFSDFTKEATSIRFSRLIKEMALNPNFAEMTQNVYNTLNPTHQETFMRLLNYQEVPQ
ncbi:hypothetical protein TRFO_34693 [Tritrichomonas foetus]|uniref:Importin N-terminal domain-containing protein n=1 Tax=Tritrichomonas foetus TaxID=1144522 RepID=A0A1J4JK24_9EUKA|nr:hypothetical protein TRFO_34693 [Tritrichomonas foetus]|eukprot:OHS98961.1 hypothetical protein TRFO_34693 [Tritrichomonas foetus]